MAESVPGSWRGVVKRYNDTSKEVQVYFADVPILIERFDWEVPLGFMFTRVEKAHNTEIARNCVDRHHMIRKEFRHLFKNVFGEPIKPTLQRTIEEAEAVRDKVVHDKRASVAEQRKAIVRILEYSEAMNDLVCELAGFKPFTSDLRGFKGRGIALDKPTTAWLMRGLGFDRKKPDEDEAG